MQKPIAIYKQHLDPDFIIMTFCVFCRRRLISEIGTLIPSLPQILPPKQIVCSLQFKAGVSGSKR